MEATSEFVEGFEYLKLRNGGEHGTRFKITTSNPECLSFQPASGFIKPKETIISKTTSGNNKKFMTRVDFFYEDLPTYEEDLPTYEEAMISKTEK